MEKCCDVFPPKENRELEQRSYQRCCVPTSRETDEKRQRRQRKNASLMIGPAEKLTKDLWKAENFKDGWLRKEWNRWKWILVSSTCFFLLPSI